MQRQDLILGLLPSEMYVEKSFRRMLVLILSADAALVSLDLVLPRRLARQVNFFAGLGLPAKPSDSFQIPLRNVD